MRVLSRAVLAALVVAVAAPAGSPSADEPEASAWVSLPNSRARLVAGGAGSTKGSLRAGVELELADGWKIYWRMPGDAGVPTTVDWKASTNAATVKVFYPAPMRMSEAGAQVIGYKKAVLLPLEVVPKDAGRPVRLEIALEYGICQDICIPVTTTLALSLPPGRTARKGDAIETALERVPRAAAQRRKTDPQLKRVARVEDKAGTRLEIDVAFPGDARGADVFIEAPDGLYVPFARRVGEDAGVVRYAVALGPDLAKDLRGRTVTITMVSDAGASEEQWTSP